MYPLSEKNLDEVALLDHARRQKLAFYPGRFIHSHISAAKAGGFIVEMHYAATWWFLADRDVNQTSSKLGGTLSDRADDNTYTLRNRPAGDVGLDYEDVTLQVESELLEAERLVKPHDFGPIGGRGLAVPEGFLEKLHEVWKRNR